MVGSHSHFDATFPAHLVAKVADPAPLRRAAQELAVAYAFHHEAHMLADYLARNPATGLLIARDGSVLFEHYQYGRTDHDRLTSQSMAKTITAMLLAGSGAVGGKQVIPRQWVLDATAPAGPDSFLAPGRMGTSRGGTWGYGYQVWLLPGGRSFVLAGVHGQLVYIDPPSGFVLVQTAVRVAPTRNPGDAELTALWAGLLAQEADPK